VPSFNEANFFGQYTSFCYIFRLSNRANFESIYSVENIDYEIVDKLESAEYKAIKNIVKNSITVRLKITRALDAKI